MTRVKYSLLTIFTIALVIIAWIFFISSAEEELPEIKEFQMAENALSRQVPRDNDSNYSFPTYIPTHNHSKPQQKVEFQSGGDNDALYSMPVAMPDVMPTEAPIEAPIEGIDIKLQKIPVKFVEQPSPEPVAPVAPVAPLQPRPRQPETPVYVPQYHQEPQYEPEYEQPSQQAQPPAEDEEVYPLYYY